MGQIDYLVISLFPKGRGSLQPYHKQRFRTKVLSVPPICFRESESLPQPLDRVTAYALKHHGGTGIEISRSCNRLRVPSPNLQ